MKNSTTSGELYRKGAEAIALCRVSTAEQKKSGSLNRQERSVVEAAKHLNAFISLTISGDASSKVGKNVDRPDLNQAFSYAKKNRQVKYLIVDEVDRFMRSTGEMFYWITKFAHEVGVQVYFASNPELNSNDARARLLLSLDAFKAEGSNEERQRKSVNGHRAAIADGRYTLPIKPGYTKGSEPGVHQPHPIHFKPLQKAFVDVLSGIYTPSEALKRLNASSFTSDHAPYRMDKFRAILTDPYYAGVVEIKKQINARNEKGRHIPMITLEEHELLIEMFTGTVKLRGPKKQYNPEFPMSKILFCGNCGSDVKFTGSRKNNGYAKKVTRYYFKYHCRGCSKEYKRDTVHQQVTERLSQIKYTAHQHDEFVKALETVWKEKQKSKLVDLKTLINQRDELSREKSTLVREMAKTSEEYKQDLRDEIDSVKMQTEKLDKHINDLSSLDKDMVNFVRFGLNYTEHLREDWWNLSHEDRVRCQLLILPGGISFNSAGKVGTPKISPIYRLITKIKEPRKAQFSRMVEMAGTAPASEK